MPSEAVSARLESAVRAVAAHVRGIQLARESRTSSRRSLPRSGGAAGSARSAPQRIPIATMHGGLVELELRETPEMREPVGDFAARIVVQSRVQGDRTGTAIRQGDPFKARRPHPVQGVPRWPAGGHGEGPAKSCWQESLATPTRYPTICAPSRSWPTTSTSRPRARPVRERRPAREGGGG